MNYGTSGFWSWQLLTAMLLNSVVQCVAVGAYASRIAGARSGRVATAISLFNLFVIVGRFASTFYTPLLGSLADRAIALTLFQWQLRLIVLAGAGGVMAGTLLLPTFVGLYMRGISAFERSGSLPKVFVRVLYPRTTLRVLQALRPASVGSVRRISLKNIPKDVLLVNMLVTSVYAIGVVSAAYASVLNAGAARTALLSSGLVNGVAAIAYSIAVDPASAYFTDQSAKGERPLDEVKSLVAFLALTAVAGFFLSQLLLVPGAHLIVAAAHAVTGR